MLKNGLAEKTRVPGSRRSRGVAGSENSYKRHVSCANPGRQAVNGCRELITNLPLTLADIDRRRYHGIALGTEGRR
jgi:hypothetical protein